MMNVKEGADVEFSENAIRQFRDDPTYNARVERVARNMMREGCQIEHIGNDIDDNDNPIPDAYVIDYDSGEIVSIRIEGDAVSVTF